MLDMKQKSLVEGCLLGKGFINCQNKLILKKKIEETGYLKYLFNELDSVVLSLRDYSTGINDYSFTYQVLSTKPIFSSLKNKWYLNNRKIVPRDLILNKTILAHWYFQSGQYLPKRKILFLKGSFSKDDFLFLISRLETDLDIFASLNKCKNKFRIRVRASSINKLINLIREEINIKFFKDKLQFSSVEKTIKLNLNKANMIRTMADKYTQQQLAKMFNVSQVTINKVINNKIYKIKGDFCTGGTAVIKTSYKFNC